MTTSHPVRSISHREKTSTSQWLKTKSPLLRDFSWQNGFAVFSITESDVPAISDYIANQHQHHKVITFQDELRMLMIEHGIEFEEICLGLNVT